MRISFFVVIFLRVVSVVATVAPSPLEYTRRLFGWRPEKSIVESGIVRSSNRTQRDTSKQPAHAVITFVNGIYHSVKDVEEIAKYLGTTFQAEVRSFYNPSSGSWVLDAYKAGFELVLRPSDLVLAKQLADHLRMALKDVRPDGGRVLHIAHSGGAILTYLAAKYHLTPSETSRIDVITLGGGRSLTHKYFRGRVYNYYARNDPVLLVDNRAAQLMRKARNTTYAVVQDAKHNTTFVFLEAIAKDPIFDHAMEGPTYRKALLWEALQFQERVQLLRHREARDKDKVRLFRKRIAKYTGVRHFWSRLQTATGLQESTEGGQAVADKAIVWPTIRSVRKFASSYTGMRGVFSGKYREKATTVPDIGVSSSALLPAVANNNDSVSVVVANETALSPTVALSDPPMLNAGNDSITLTMTMSDTTIEHNSQKNRTLKEDDAIAALTNTEEPNDWYATFSEALRSVRKLAAHYTGWRGAVSGKYAPVTRTNESNTIAGLLPEISANQTVLSEPDVIDLALQERRAAGIPDPPKETLNPQHSHEITIALPVPIAEKGDLEHTHTEDKEHSSVNVSAIFDAREATAHQAAGNHSTTTMNGTHSGSVDQSITTLCLPAPPQPAPPPSVESETALVPIAENMQDDGAKKEAVAEDIRPWEKGFLLPVALL